MNQLPHSIRPNLTPSTARDTKALARRLEQLLTENAGHRSASAQITALQRMLRERLDDAAWDAYLDLEAAVNARESEDLRMVVRWAYSEGRGG